MEKKLFLVFGVVAIVVAYTLCLTHAANDYGIVKNSLSVSVLAQDTGSGGNGGSTTGEGGGTTGGGGSLSGDTSGSTSDDDDDNDDGEKKWDVSINYSLRCYVVVNNQEVTAYMRECNAGNTHVDCTPGCP